ncbi:MAG: hypothetical protein LBE38_08190 [Deltaproteobacteria bacterium]|jgi:hypothetical protein|nr:hypothetical protein [Deltaproteobacteria bacterium]
MENLMKLPKKGKLLGELNFHKLWLSTDTAKKSIPVRGRYFLRGIDNFHFFSLEKGANLIKTLISLNLYPKRYYIKYWDVSKRSLLNIADTSLQLQNNYEKLFVRRIKGAYFLCGLQAIEHFRQIEAALKDYEEYHWQGSVFSSHLPKVWFSWHKAPNRLRGIQKRVKVKTLWVNSSLSHKITSQYVFRLSAVYNTLSGPTFTDCKGDLKTATTFQVLLRIIYLCLKILKNGQILWDILPIYSLILGKPG